MAFSIEQFCSIRPYLYHLTSKSNLKNILEAKMLYSAEHILHNSGNPELLNEKRGQSLSVQLGGKAIHVRDQLPLHRGNVSFAPGWDFRRLLIDLNSRVFFWPGTESRPIDYGIRHFERYRAERPVILRFKSAELIPLQSVEPHFCKYNSGSPRCSQGKGSPRGADTFTAAPAAKFSAANVVEVTFKSRVSIPSLQWGESTSGPWTNE